MLRVGVVGVGARAQGHLRPIEALGPRSAPDIAYHATILLVLAWGLVVAARTTAERSQTSPSRCFLGKVAITTGASRGIGAATARAFVAAGAAVALAARDAAALQALAQELSAASGRARVAFGGRRHRGAAAGTARRSRRSPLEAAR